MLRLSLVLVFLILATSEFTQAQNFQPRSQPYSSGAARGATVARVGQAEAASRQSSVSEDLLRVYALTQSAKSESEVTVIARACAKVISDANRSQTDRDYAGSLLAWSLNRRGELRSESAARLVEAGKPTEAAQLDSQATDDFLTAVEYAPKNWRNRHNLAIALAMKSDYRGAVEQLTEAIRLNPDYANAKFNRGELFFELGQYERALGDYTAAIECDEQDPQYFNSRAHCRFLLEDYPAAIEDYRKAAELASDSAVYHTDLADACQFIGNWEEAAQAYRSAVAINNKYARAYQNAAWLMATCPDTKLRNNELALSAAKKAIELSPERSAELVDTLAAATAALGRHAEAAKLQAEAVALAGDDEQRTELEQRQQLYQQGRAFTQVPPSEISRESKPPVRTASSKSEPTR